MNERVEGPGSGVVARRGRCLRGAPIPPFAALLNVRSLTSPHSSPILFPIVMHSINITEGMSRRLKCMAHGCGVVCDEDKVGGSKLGLLTVWEAGRGGSGSALSVAARAGASSGGRSGPGCAPPARLLPTHPPTHPPPTVLFAQVKTLLRGQGPLLQKYEQALLGEGGAGACQGEPFASLSPQLPFGALLSLFLFRSPPPPPTHTHPPPTPPPSPPPPPPHPPTQKRTWTTTSE